MSSNYPPGVTGNEYAIAGPDYERESDIRCLVPVISGPDSTGALPCGKMTMEQGYHGDRWLVCEEGHVTDLEPFDDEPDPDRAYDEAVERRLFGED